MASIFATALTFPSYSNPTGVGTTLTALTGTLTVPDPGFAWTPIVMGCVAFTHDSPVYTGQAANQAYPEVLAQVDVRMGAANTGTLVASGAGSAGPGGSAGFQRSNASSAGVNYNLHHAGGIVDVSQQYAANVVGAPSFTGAQTLTAWIKKVSGQNNIDTIAGTCNLMVYILPTT